MSEKRKILIRPHHVAGPFQTFFSALMRHGNVEEAASWTATSTTLAVRGGDPEYVEDVLGETEADTRRVWLATRKSLIELGNADLDTKVVIDPACNDMFCAACFKGKHCDRDRDLKGEARDIKKLAKKAEELGLEDEIRLKDGKLKMALKVFGLIASEM